ncbi:MAG: hypothetical protein ACE5FQ_16015 [Thiogranum sp.]
MNERRRDAIRRRSSVLDEEQTARADTGAVHVKRSHHDRPLRKIVPLLVFLAIAFLIARQEIPAVADAWQRLVAPDNWRAQQLCQQAAVARSGHREFTRVLKPGRVNRTSDGKYIDRLVIGEMGQSGDEVPVEYSCYVDSEGRLAKLNRIEVSQ